MTSIELKSSEKLIIIDGKSHEIWQESPRKGEPYLWEVGSNEEEISFLKLISCNKKDFPDRFEAVGSFKNNVYEYFNFVSVIRNNGNFKIELSGLYTWSEWPYLFRLDKFLVLFLEKINKLSLVDLKTEFLDSEGDSYPVEIDEISIPDDEFPIYYINKISSELRKIHDEVCIQMDKMYSVGSFFAHFSFSEHYKRACEQYLMYFGEFLADLGIDSNTSVREYGSEVLFEVSPTNKDEAIEKIYQAFQIFLSLPKHQDHLSIKANKSEQVLSEIKIQRLMAVVDQLKGQLRLSNALVKIKEEELLIIKSGYNDEVMSKSLIDINKKEDGSELHLFDKTVTLKPFKGKWFDIDTPRIVKKIIGKNSLSENQ